MWKNHWICNCRGQHDLDNNRVSGEWLEARLLWVRKGGNEISKGWPRFPRTCLGREGEGQSKNHIQIEGREWGILLACLLVF